MMLLCFYFVVVGKMSYMIVSGPDFICLVLAI